MQYHVVRTILLSETKYFSVSHQNCNEPVQYHYIHNAQITMRTQFNSILRNCFCRFCQNILIKSHIARFVTDCETKQINTVLHILKSLTLRPTVTFNLAHPARLNTRHLQ